MKTIFSAVAALSLLVSFAMADSLFSYNTTLVAQARVDGPYVIGSLFRVDQVGGVTVTHLGIQDADAPVDAQDPDGADGLTGFADDDGFFRDTFGGGAPLEVGLWSADGVSLLASASVSSSDPVMGSYRYVTLTTPVSLTEGTSYLIGAAVGGGIEWFLDGESAGNAPVSAETGITLLENRFAVAVGGALAAPVNNGAGTLGRWASANALFTRPSVSEEPFQITSIQRDDETGEITLTWNSRLGEVYSVDSSTSLEAELQLGGWGEVEDSIESQGTQTTYSFVPAASPTVEFYRVRESTPN